MHLHCMKMHIKDYHILTQSTFVRTVLGGFDIINEII